ncbi:hypothetical protein M1N69_02440 [Thermodesulfovibrionales bacterium]|nr:hypothetical protein [Thermodesulfovibrionales bacterium]
MSCLLLTAYCLLLTERREKGIKRRKEVPLSSFIDKSKTNTLRVLATLFGGLEYLGSNCIVLGKIYDLLFYRKMVRREIVMAKLSPGAKVLHIGSGPLPLTATCLSTIGFRVDAVDNSNAAIRAAVKVAKNYNLDKAINFIEGEGIEIDCSAYDAVWVSFSVSPMEEVVRKVLSTLKNGGRVIYRNSRGWLSILYQQAKPKVIADFYPHRRISHSLWKESVIITKNPFPEE